MASSQSSAPNQSNATISMTITYQTKPKNAKKAPQQKQFKFQISNQSNASKAATIPIYASITNSFITHFHWFWDMAVKHSKRKNYVTDHRRTTFENVSCVLFRDSNVDSMELRPVKLHLNSTALQLEFLDGGGNGAAYQTQSVWYFHLIRRMQIVSSDHVVIYYGTTGYTRLVLSSEQRNIIVDIIKENMKQAYGVSVDVVVKAHNARSSQSPATADIDESSSSSPLSNSPIAEFALFNRKSIERDIRVRQLVRRIPLNTDAARQILNSTSEDKSNATIRRADHILKQFKALDSSIHVELLLTEDSIYECDAVTGAVFSQYYLHELYSVVRLAGDESSFMLEYNTETLPALYINQSSKDSSDSPSSPSSPQALYQNNDKLRRFITQNSFRDGSSRDEFLSSIVELCDRSKKVLIVKTEPLSQSLFTYTPPGGNPFNSSLVKLKYTGYVKFAEKFHTDQELDEVILKNVASLNAKEISIASSLHQESPTSDWVSLLQMFISNFNINDHSHSRDKKAVKNVVVLLRKLHELDQQKKRELEEKKERAEQEKRRLHPNATEEEIALPPVNQLQTSALVATYYVLVLHALACLLTVREVQESLDTHIADIAVVLKLIRYQNPMVSYMASVVLRMCIDQIFPHKSVKKEIANRTLMLNRKVPVLDEVEFRFENGGSQVYSLMLGSIMTSLELVLHSSYLSTERVVFESYYEQVLNHLPQLLKLCWVSSSVQIVYNTLSVLRVALGTLRARSSSSPSAEGRSQFELVQQSTLQSGAQLQLLHLLNHYPLGLNDVNTTLNASLVLGILSEGHISTMNMLRRVIPRGIYKLLEGKMHENAPGSSQVDFATLFNRKVVEAQKPPVDKQQSAKGATAVVAKQLPSLSLQWVDMSGAFSLNAANAVLIWNSETRRELCSAIEEEMRALEVEKYECEQEQGSLLQQGPVQVVWNHEEFQIVYPSLEREAIVGHYYLRFFVSDADALGLGKNQPIERPLQFMEQLHHCITFERRDVKKRLLALKAISRVCTLYKQQVGVYPYIHHLLEFISQVTDLSGTTQLIVHASLGFLIQLLVCNEGNVEKFIASGGIHTIMRFITLIHAKQDEASQESNAAILKKIGDEVKAPLNVMLSECCIQLLSLCVNLHQTQNDRGEILVPPPRTKHILTTHINENHYLQHIVQLIVAATPEATYPNNHNATKIIVNYVVPIIAELISYNDQLQSQMWRFGLFYFLLLIGGEFNEYIVHLLRQIHRKQTGFPVQKKATSNAPKAPIIQSDALSAPPAVPSFLDNLLPLETVRMLDKLPAREFVKAFNGSSGTPLMIWNDSMKEQLRTGITTFVSSFISTLHEDRNAVFVHPDNFLVIEYPQLKDSFVCRGYYMDNLVDRTTWPEGFSIEDPEAFLNELCQAMNSKLSAAKEQRTKEDMRMVSTCLKAQIIVFKHSENAQEVFRNYAGSFSLLQCLRVDGAVGRFDVEVLYFAVSLCESIVKIGRENGELVLSVGIVATLQNIIRSLLSQIDMSKVVSPQQRQDNKALYLKTLRESSAPADEDEEDAPAKVDEGDEFDLTYLTDDDIMAEVISSTLRTLMHLLQNHQTETLDRIAEQQQTEGESFACTLMRILMCNVESCHDMIENALVTMSLLMKLPELQRSAYRAGVLPFLLSFIRDHDKGAHEMRRAQETVIVLRNLTGLNEDVLSYPRNDEILLAVQHFYPKHLVTNLQKLEPAQFLQEYNKITITPRILWNESTIEELNTFLDNETRHICGLYDNGIVTYDTDRLHAFTYRTHAMEVRSHFIFVRQFNSWTPTHKDQNFFLSPDEAQQFVSGLIQNLTDEITRLNEEHDAGRQLYFMDRIEVIMEALFRCLSMFTSKWMRYTDTLIPTLVTLLGRRAVPQNAAHETQKEHRFHWYKIFYFVLELLFHALSTSEPAQATVIGDAMLNAGLVLNFKKLLFQTLLRPTPENKSVELDKNSSEVLMVESIITIFFRLLSNPNITLTTAELHEHGLTILLVSLLNGVPVSSAVLRAKSAHVLSEMLKRDETKALHSGLQNILPHMLVTALERNPMESPSYLKEAYSSPELIWSEKRVKLLIDHLRERLYDYVFKVYNSDAPETVSFEFAAPLDYDLPPQIAGIFTSLYAENPSYPIVDMKTFVNALVAHLIKKGDYTETSESAVNIAEALYVATGGERSFNSTAVDALTPHVEDLSKLLLAPDTIPDATQIQYYMLQIFSKLSLYPPALTRLEHAKDILGRLQTAMKNQVDSVAVGLDVVLRLSLRSRTIVEKFTPESDLVQYLIEILRSSNTSLKERASQILVKACEQYGALIEQLGSLYDDYIKEAETPNETELFHQPKPTLISGDRFSNVNIDLDRRNENDKETKLLFGKLSSENVLLKIKSSFNLLQTPVATKEDSTVPSSENRRQLGSDSAETESVKAPEVQSNKTSSAPAVAPVVQRAPVQQEKQEEKKVEKKVVEPVPVQTASPAQQAPANPPPPPPVQGTIVPVQKEVAPPKMSNEPPPKSTAPPPPPPPLPPAGLASKPAPPAGGPPPPPPPPPANFAVKIPQSSGGPPPPPPPSGAPKLPLLDAPPAGRSDMLAQIRAGAFKLKKVETADKTSAVGKQNGSSSSGPAMRGNASGALGGTPRPPAPMSLQDELRNRIAMRREAIQNEEASGDDSDLSDGDF